MLLLSPQQVLALLGLKDKRTLKGLLPVRQLGGHDRYDAGDVAELLERSKKEPARG